MFQIFRRLSLWSLKKSPGQGLVEYAGGMMVAAFIVTLLIVGIQTNNWMFNAYNMIFTATQQVIANGVAAL